MFLVGFGPIGGLHASHGREDSGSRPRLKALLRSAFLAILRYAHCAPEILTSQAGGMLDDERIHAVALRVGAFNVSVGTVAEYLAPLWRLYDRANGFAPPH